MTYKIQLISYTNSLIVKFIIVAALFTGFFLFDVSQHEVRIYVIMAAVYTGGFLLHLKFVAGKTEWKLDIKGISIMWLKKIPFAGCKDLQLEWSHIKNIRTRVSHRSHSIIIFLSNGGSITFYHNEMVRKDDLQGFINALDNYCA